MGVTDNYVVISTNINNVKSTAVYNIDRSIVMDYKYKEIISVSKDIFIAKNNADIFGIIDNKGKELVSFSLRIYSFSRSSDLCYIYEAVKRSGILLISPF